MDPEPPKPHMGDAIPAEENRQTHRPSHLPRPHQPERRQASGGHGDRLAAIIHPLTHGRFDPENAAPMVKAILDAGTQAGMWPDDNAEYIIGPDYRPGTPSPDKTTYHITIRIEQADHR